MDLTTLIDSEIRDVPDFPKEGILFKDITPILENPELSGKIVDEFYSRCKSLGIEAIVGVESRGFLFGFPVAMKLGVPFILVRKKGKLPYKTISYKYDLEYGSAEIEMHEGSIHKGMSVMVHDDLLATGGTAAAAAELILQQGAKVAGFSFLVELDFLEGKKKLDKYSNNIISITNY